MVRSVVVIGTDIVDILELVVNPGVVIVGDVVVVFVVVILGVKRFGSVSLKLVVLVELAKVVIVKGSIDFVDPLSSIVVVPISSLSNSVVTDNVCVSWAKLVASVVVLISSVFIGVACNVPPFVVCVVIEVCCSIVTLSGS